MTISAAGAAKPEAVWQQYIHPDRWSDWSPQISAVDYPGEVRATPGVAIGAGGVGTVHALFGVRVHFEILNVNAEKRCWSWRVAVAGIRMTLVHDVTPHESGTRTGLQIDGPAPVVALYAPVARLALGRLVR